MLPNQDERRFPADTAHGPRCSRCGAVGIEHVTLELSDTEVTLDLCEVHLHEVLRGARPVGGV
jgi:hypothetical protein